jgi:DNA-binding MarR family transcriptional regulator
VRRRVEKLIAAGTAQRDEGGVLTLTAKGREIADKMCEVRLQLLEEQLRGWDPDKHEELIAFLRVLADDSLDAYSAGLVRE